jgi:hypothetical protein
VTARGVIPRRSRHDLRGCIRRRRSSELTIASARAAVGAQRNGHRPVASSTVRGAADRGGSTRGVLGRRSDGAKRAVGTSKALVRDMDATCANSASERLRGFRGRASRKTAEYVRRSYARSHSAVFRTAAGGRDLSVYTGTPAVGQSGICARSCQGWSGGKPTRSSSISRRIRPGRRTGTFRASRPSWSHCSRYSTPVRLLDVAVKGVFPRPIQLLAPTATAAACLGRAQPMAVNWSGRVGDGLRNSSSAIASRPPAVLLRRQPGHHCAATALLRPCARAVRWKQIDRPGPRKGRASVDR